MRDTFLFLNNTSSLYFVVYIYINNFFLFDLIFVCKFHRRKKTFFIILLVLFSCE